MDIVDNLDILSIVERISIISIMDIMDIMDKVYILSSMDIMDSMDIIYILDIMDIMDNMDFMDIISIKKSILYLCPYFCIIYLLYKKITFEKGGLSICLEKSLP